MEFRGRSLAVLGSGEKLKMVCGTNKLFIQLAKNLEEEHAEELRNNRAHKNKLFYTRQDYSKNEKKLKRSKQQLENIQEDIELCKRETLATSDQSFRLYSEQVMENGSLVDEQIQHQRLCARQGMRTKLFTFGQLFGRKVQEEQEQGKSKLRKLCERVFGMKGRQQKKYNVDINSMLFEDCSQSRTQILRVLKDIGKTSSTERSGTKSLACNGFHKLAC